MDTPPPSATPLSKQEILLAARSGMPKAIVNLLLASCLRASPVTLARTPRTAIPAALASAALPVTGSTEDCLLPCQNQELLPNYAGDILTVLPLLEELRQRYPRFHYRISCERVAINAQIVDGYRVDVSEPNTPSYPNELIVRMSINGDELALVAAFAVLDYLLDQPGMLERANLHMQRGTPPLPAVGLPSATLQ